MSYWNHTPQHIGGSDYASDKSSLRWSSVTESASPKSMCPPVTDPNVQVAVVYRVANDLHCSLGALAEFDDSQPGPPVGRFRHFGILPGLATAHASVVFDAQTDMYFMVANAARDSLLPWDASMAGPQCAPPS